MLAEITSEENEGREGIRLDGGGEIKKKNGEEEDAFHAEEEEEWQASPIPFVTLKSTDRQSYVYTLRTHSHMACVRVSILQGGQNLKLLSFVSRMN